MIESVNLILAEIGRDAGSNTYSIHLRARVMVMIRYLAS